jgi:hypothetical protein
MSLFSRRSMTIVAGCALTLPLAAGTADAAFDIAGDGAAPVEQLSASADGSVAPAGGSGSVGGSIGDGTVAAGTNGARVEACAAAGRPCASLRGPRVPVARPGPLAVDAGRLAADADGVVSQRGMTAKGSIRVPGERVGGSIDASPDDATLTADTPVGNGSTHVETESFDIHVE